MPLYPQNLVALGSRRFKPGSPSPACTCSDVVRTPHTERKRERVTSRCCSSPVCGGVSPGNGREGEAAVNHQDFSFITDVFHSLHCLFLFSTAHLASFSFLSGPVLPGPGQTWPAIPPQFISPGSRACLAPRQCPGARAPPRSLPRKTGRTKGRELVAVLNSLPSPHKRPSFFTP